MGRGRVATAKRQKSADPNCWLLMLLRLLGCATNTLWTQRETQWKGASNTTRGKTSLHMLNTVLWKRGIQPEMASEVGGWWWHAVEEWKSNIVARRPARVVLAMGVTWTIKENELNFYLWLLVPKSATACLRPPKWRRRRMANFHVVVVARVPKQGSTHTRTPFRIRTLQRDKPRNGNELSKVKESGGRWGGRSCGRFDTKGRTVKGRMDSKWRNDTISVLTFELLLALLEKKDECAFQLKRHEKQHELSRISTSHWQIVLLIKKVLKQVMWYCVVTKWVDASR